MIEENVNVFNALAISVCSLHPSYTAIPSLTRSISFDGSSRRGEGDAKDGSSGTCSSLRPPSDRNFTAAVLRRGQTVF